MEKAPIKDDPGDVTTVHRAVGPEGERVPENDPVVPARAARLPTSRLALIGFGVLLIGLWGGGVAYFGPEIGFAPSGATAWQSTWTNTALALLPGACAVVGGLIMLVGSRFGLLAHRLGGLMALAAGAWFVLGAYVWPVFYRTPYAPYAQAGSSPRMHLAMVAGYGAGVGIALCVLGGMAMAIGAGVWRRAVPATVVRERRTPAVTTIREPVGV